MFVIVILNGIGHCKFSSYPAYVPTCPIPFPLALTPFKRLLRRLTLKPMPHTGAAINRPCGRVTGVIWA